VNHLRLSEKLGTPLDLSQITNVSQQCREDSLIYLNALRNLDLWALKIYDASAKLPSGILNGNVNQFGDFDQCLDVISPANFQGQYCLAYLQPENINDDKLKELEVLMQSHHFLNSNFDEVWFNYYSDSQTVCRDTL
jgi:hypothetical protein